MSKDSMISNLSYTSKDFNTIYPELLDLVKKLTYKWDPSISNESDPGVILIKLNALIADKCNYNSDKNVLETFPASVTQDSNARQLYEQLGYYMHWYESAVVPVYISFTGDTSSYTEDDNCTIPAFTAISDENNNIVYSLLGTSGNYVPGDARLKLNGEAALFDAIQGIAVKYEINGETTIQAANLDSHNRLYFPTNDIAQNGVYIKNVNNNNYIDWVRKDNLEVENLGNTYFKFGVEIGTNACYLEFPEDAEELFDAGIEITYIRTLGVGGTVPSFYLSKFYDDITVQTNLVEDSSTLLLNGDNTVITNLVSSSGAKDTETIEEAYKGYKRVLGTYDTLITLRDYVNAVLKSGLVSNGFVTDRKDDIQNTYTIQSNSDSVNSEVRVIDYDDNTGDICLSAFDLKLYLLQYSADILDIDNEVLFNNTFEMVGDTSEVKNYIEEQKSISHDYKDLSPINRNRSNFCLFKNKYPIVATIIPNHSVSQTEQDSILKNIKTAIYRNLNSKLMNFGESIDRADIRNIIMNSDSRIADIILSEIEYKTYAVYWTGREFREVDINSTDGTIVDISQSHLSSVKPIAGYPIYYTTATYSSGTEYNKYDLCRYYAGGNSNLYYCRQDNTTGVAPSNQTYWRRVFAFSATGSYTADESNTSKITVAAHGDWIYKYIYAVDTENIVWNSNYWELLDNNETNTIQWTYTRFLYDYNEQDELVWKVDYNDGEGFIEIGQRGWDTTDTINKHFSYKGTPQPGDIVTIEISPATQFRNEIYAKSILAGVTPLFVEDNEYNYDINHTLTSSHAVEYNGDELPFSSYPIENVQRILPHLDIVLDAENPYQLRDNESAQFYAPNLVDSVNYSNYTIYDYNIPGGVNPTENYQLQNGEYIVFYWKASADDNVYQYTSYGEGCVICPTVRLDGFSTDNEVTISLEPTSSDNVSRTGGTVLMKSGTSSPAQATSIASIGRYLSGSSSITAKFVNQVTLNQGNRFYWALNSKLKLNDSYTDEERYVLFENPEDDETGDYKGTYSTATTYQKGDIVEYTNENNISQYYECITTTSGQFDLECWTLSKYSERILDAGEYAFYSDSQLSSFNILGPGTKIIRTNSGTQWSVDAISTEEINSKGASSLVEDWFVVPPSSSITAIEQQFYNVGPGCWVRLKDNSGYVTLSSDTLTDLSQYKIEYSTSKELPSDDDYIQLPDVNVSGSGWEGRSHLIINCGDGKEQILLSGQSVQVISSDYEYPIFVYGSDLLDSKYGCVMQFKEAVNSENISTDITTQYTNSKGDVYYNSLIVYGKNTDTQRVKYPLSGGAAVYVKGRRETPSGFETQPLPDIINYGYLALSYSAISGCGFKLFSSNADYQNRYYAAVSGGECVFCFAVSQGTFDYIYFVSSDDYATAGATYYSGGNSVRTKAINTYDSTTGLYYGVIDNISAGGYDMIPQYDDFESGMADAKIAISNQNTATSFSFKLKHLDGNEGYILPFYNPYGEGLNDLSVTLSYTQDGETQEIQLGEFSNGNIYLADRRGIYYLKLDIPDDVLDDTLLTITVDMDSEVSSTKTFTFSHLFKYKISEEIAPVASDGTTNLSRYNALLSLIQNEFDYDGIFNYTYEIPDEKLIENPLNPSSFMNVNHIYNRYTICQTDLLNNDIIVSRR